MRALRVILILSVLLGGLFVLVDRLALNFAESEVADRLRTSEGLDETPDVSIKGFPFLTQLAGGELDDIEVGIKDYEASTGGDGGTGTVRIDGLKANMKGVAISSDFSSATAGTASGTAAITYAELLKTAQTEPTEITSGVTAKVVGLSDGGDGKIKVDVDVDVDATVYGTELSEQVSVLGKITAEGDTIRVRAESIPSIEGVNLTDSQIREITDFEQKIDGLPGGIKLDGARTGKKGVDLTMRGSNVSLAG